MKRKNILALTLVLVFALSLAACGSKEPAETTAPVATTEAVVFQPLALTDWTMSATTWSSPNGATISIAATPNYYDEANSATFIVRLEGEESANIPCQWDGSQYTASADLNAADGYCYYVVLTSADGTVTEVPVNTPTDPTDEAFINMADSLNAYCNVMIEQSQCAEGKLTITAGTVHVQAPKITNQGETITCKDVALVLYLNGEGIAKEALTLNETDDTNAYELVLSGVTFNIPEVEEGQQMELRLEVTLSNGQSLSAPGGLWYNSDKGLLPAVG